MRITQKGQVTIPGPIRRKAGLLPGTEVEFVVGKKGILLRARKAGRRVSRRERDEEASSALAAVSRHGHDERRHGRAREPGAHHHPDRHRGEPEERQVEPEEDRDHAGRERTGQRRRVDEPAVAPGGRHRGLCAS